MPYKPCKKCLKKFQYTLATDWKDKCPKCFARWAHVRGIIRDAGYENFKGPGNSNATRKKRMQT